jgi:hypothetical protein
MSNYFMTYVSLFLLSFSSSQSGRFAAEYARRFGRKPSETLHAISG